MHNHIISKFDHFILESTNRYIYHGTGVGQALNIQRDGFMKPSNSGEDQPSISFTGKLDYAKYYANAKGGAGKMVILRTSLDDKFKLSPKIRDNKGYEYVTFDKLPTSKLDILTPDGNWVSLDGWNVVFNEPMVSESVTEPKFQIPDAISDFYDISGDFSNVKNWKAKIILNNNSGRGTRVGDFEPVGYVLISLSSNYIIPVARSDEHQTGYDLLYHLINKYKLKPTDYQSMFMLGNHYVYGGEYEQKEKKTIQKAYHYGARNILIRQANGERRSMDIADYIKYDGDFVNAIKISKEQKLLSVEGQNFIDILTEITRLFEQYLTNPLRQNKKFESSIVKISERLYHIIASNDVLYDIVNKPLKLLDNAVESGDIKSIEHAIFSFGGIKNTIHMRLKRDDKEVEKFFWCNENALEQFNALSTIKL